ncbi:MAG: hypothetical protein LBL39_05695 [Planctomycetaceae bacterium]|nr:hypothetical protein [Planctomycetaceae bacterium]
MTSWITGGGAERNHRSRPIQTKPINNVAASAAQCLFGSLSDGCAPLHRRLCIITPLARLRRNL